MSSLPVSIAIALCAAGVGVTIAVVFFPGAAGDGIGWAVNLSLMAWGIWLIDKQRDGK